MDSTRGQGPSPRARGSLPCSRSRRFRVGSIPACAGKPFFNRTVFRRHGVHPRVRGEAVHHVSRTNTEAGPSPRARGSLIPFGKGDAWQGSIPACAGKPHAG